MEKFAKNLCAAISAVLVACLVLAYLPKESKADLGDTTTVYRGGLVAATTTVTSVTITDMAPAAFYFENQDTTDTIVIKFGGSTAAYAGTSADYTNQLVLGPGESVSFEVFNVRYLSVDASGNANLEWRATGFER